MRKNITTLLTLLSFVALFIGFSFLVPYNDDKESSPSAVYEKYCKKNGVCIEGDDVVYTKKFNGYTTVTLIHFNGNNVESGTSYTDYQNEEVTKKAYDALMPSGDEVQIDGTILIQTISNDEVETDYEGLTKEQLCSFLKWI